MDVYRSLGEPQRTTEQLEQFVAPFRDDFVAAARDFVERRLLPGAAAELVEWVAADMSAAPPAIALDAIRHAITNDEAVLAGLRQLGAPLVAINPGHLPTDVEALLRHGVRTTLLPNVSHFPMLEDAEGFNRALGETVEEFAR